MQCRFVRLTWGKDMDEKLNRQLKPYERVVSMSALDDEVLILIGWDN